MKSFLVALQLYKPLHETNMMGLYHILDMYFTLNLQVKSLKATYHVCTCAFKLLTTLSDEFSYTVYLWEFT